MEIALGNNGISKEEVSKKAKEVISIYYKAYKQHDAENPGDHKESVREAYKKANKKFNEIIKENRKVSDMAKILIESAIKERKRKRKNEKEASCD